MQQLLDYLAAQADRACAIQTDLCAIPALGPENGGQGELAKMAYVQAYLKKCGFTDLRRIDCPDPRVESGIRPNLIAQLPGQLPQTLWLYAHLDVVPPGEGWNGDPWLVRRDGDFIYGRGVEDNQQGATSMLLLAQALHRLGMKPPRGLGLVFMADEECGSACGMKHILAAAPDFSQENDLHIVPDGGSPKANEIEIAEKAQLWLKFAIRGLQGHAAMALRRDNPLLPSSALLLALDGLRDHFYQRNPLFNPWRSTFMPTRRENPDTPVNIVPGREVFYLDCRLLPEVDVEAVKSYCHDCIRHVLRDWGEGVTITMEVVQFQPASQTGRDSAVYRELAAAISAIYDVKPRPVGIGGATVASFLRQAGRDTVVWSCIQNTCHMANERSSLSATCKDAAVFARLLWPGANEANAAGAPRACSHV